jgi:hypothetical protein
MWASEFQLNEKINILRLWDTFGSQFDKSADYLGYEILRREVSAEINRNGAPQDHVERQQLARSFIASGKRSTLGPTSSLDSFLGVTGKL